MELILVGDVVASWDALRNQFRQALIFHFVEFLWNSDRRFFLMEFQKPLENPVTVNLRTLIHLGHSARMRSHGEGFLAKFPVW
jgi:hypothetical protein